jgi:hypothetical protein
MRTVSVPFAEDLKTDASTVTATALAPIMQMVLVRA